MIIKSVVDSHKFTGKTLKGLIKAVDKLFLGIELPEREIVIEANEKEYKMILSFFKKEVDAVNSQTMHMVDSATLLKMYFPELGMTKIIVS